MKATVGIGLLIAAAIPFFILGKGMSASAQAGSKAEQEVRQAENARREALLRNDISERSTA